MGRTARQRSRADRCRVSGISERSAQQGRTPWHSYRLARPGRPEASTLLGFKCLGPWRAHAGSCNGRDGSFGWGFRFIWHRWLQHASASAAASLSEVLKSVGNSLRRGDAREPDKSVAPARQPGVRRAQASGQVWHKRRAQPWVAWDGDGGGVSSCGRPLAWFRSVTRDASHIGSTSLVTNITIATSMRTMILMCCKVC